MIAMVAAGGLLACAFCTDVASRKIPNWLTVSAFAAGWILHTVTDGWNGLMLSGAGAAAGLLPMLALYLLRAVGAGDVKLFAAIGALMGVELTLQLMVSSLMASGVVAMMILIWRRELRVRGQRVLLSLFRITLLHDREELTELHKGKDYMRFPFMWAVLPGAAMTYWQWL